MKTFSKTSDLLGAAHDQMATRGQNRIQDFGSDGTVCQQGALFAALGFNKTPECGHEAWKVIRPAWWFLGNAMGARGILGTPMTFNGRHGLNDCLELFHEAQILAKEAGD